ncbi:rho GTPase-activating protein 26 isoform X2 [Diorhabda carinulata]|uniref:rho GTPase-activating protein 26 isoform X2 n=1 Tax=Diorhabda sublineata TaxID=1163346 RepID=UPI0024E046B5|nr:rho GTPase-activating protein 26 isoform X2 [Diorhabda sublineata]XP_057660114.1 rho GTPase-activating protein 26 isoform X2 [Diorhabda carinulata]
MGVVLPPLEFTECLSDSPYFRENLHKHERELEKTNQHIKRIIKEVKDLLTSAKQLGRAQRSFAECLKSFTFECVGGTQTDDEQVISASLSNFADLINQIEDERDRMLENANSCVVKPLEDFRKKYIGGAKNEKKKFEKQTAKFCQNQERYLNLTTKKTNSLQEADASVDMAERHFYTASMDYVYLIQEVHERKKFEFVETLLTFIYSWFTFYHQGYELKRDCDPYWKDLQTKIQKTRNNFDDFSQILRKRMSEVQKQDEPIRNAKGCREGYLFLLEKKAFGTTWTKHYCSYDKETKIFTMLPYNQLTTKTLPPPEKMVISSCVRRMSDSIEKRFCFDLLSEDKPNVTFTFQALSDQDRKAWMDIMDGKEPTYTIPNNVNKNVEEKALDDNGIQFVKRCIEVLESRGLEEQGLYRVVGVSSKVTKLLNMGLDRRKGDKLLLDDPVEWETKTITSALKMYLRNLPEPLMTFRFHNGFIAAVKNESKQTRIKDVHTLLYRLPKINFEVLKILMKHLTNVVAKCDKNLMTVSNLGVCFGPTLLRPEEETVASILDLKFYNIVVEILIENYQRLFFNEPDSLSPKYVQPPATSNNSQSIYGSPNNHLPTYMNSDDGLGRSYIEPTKISSNFRDRDYPQPYTCTVSSYIEPRISSSTFSVNEASNGSYDLTRSEHISGRTSHNQQRFKQMLSTVSQSETHLPTLHNYSPPNFRPFSNRLANSTSSSNESLSSTSRDGIGILPKKTKRTSYYMGYPKNYKSPGYVKLHSPTLVTNTSSRRSSPTPHKTRRVRTLYACLGEQDGELSFEPNQIITNVKSSPEPGWLEGTLNGKTGLIPENYVEVLP